MSVYRRNVIEAEGNDIKRVMIDHEGFGLVSLSANQFRMKDQTVFPDPLSGESSHTKVCGPKTESNRRWFARESEWVIPPAN
jgi:hypothetical protein